MKKLFILMAAAVMALCTVSCEKEESIDKKDLYGMWVLTQPLYDGEDMSAYMPNMTITIKSDGTGTVVQITNSQNNTTEFTWSVKGKKLIIQDTAYYENGVLDDSATDFGKTTMTVKKLTSDTLVVTYTIAESGKNHNVQMTFSRLVD